MAHHAVSLLVEPPVIFGFLRTYMMKPYLKTHEHASPCERKRAVLISVAKSLY